MKRDELVQDIIETLARCQRASVNPSEWNKIGLSHSQVGMLFMILHRKDSNVKQIAEHLGVTKSAITQLLDPLVTKGFIDRQNDPDDRRIVRFSLSDKGKKTIKEIHKQKFSGLRSALDSLSDTELNQLASLHRKAVQNISK
jgi:MarR family 2-MHQ and catechol resistance regulon transcriptional repressor